jgi:hypothetical protein
MKPLRCIAPLLWALLFLAAPALAQVENFGRFEGPIQVQWDNASRRMRLLSAVTYVGPNDTSWTAPAGFETDGASIPRVFWSIIGGPFDGPYRDAAVVHDRYCVTMSRPWKDVHRMFYHASLASGVSKLKAKVLYLAVYAGGPRWYKYPAGMPFVFQPQVSDTDARELVKWAEGNEPSLEDIESHVDSVREASE